LPIPKVRYDSPPTHARFAPQDSPKSLPTKPLNLRLIPAAETLGTPATAWKSAQKTANYLEKQRPVPILFRE